MQGRDVQGRDAQGRDVEGTNVEGRNVEGSDVQGSDWGKDAPMIPKSLAVPKILQQRDPSPPQKSTQCSVPYYVTIQRLTNAPRQGAVRSQWLFH